ncbi:5-formyltetrahydrofolate cyclo-ligase [Candidatus Puniceispirillum marinum]|uniref:5-formyltetrahydrofolate cyclo-ligase n=1 Tax=Puniceispirillum marinum (strain IMCC1322) TaxID=488538 RepID=D5BPN0_PUNMI|nr:5-formyltetrahydrofolate cyclo-ligase [Candidatus Puniceispirillum marinum]ADE40532.1 5-formyltetrahydrofolate cyclo-ligase [Candidatus Puniceispirillum marinum IMCC1322]
MFTLTVSVVAATTVIAGSCEMTSQNVSVDPADEKQALRRAATKTRKILFEQQTHADMAIADYADRLLGQFGRGIYAAYLPIRSELSPLPLVARLADSSVQTAMPITPAPGNPLDFRLWAPGDKLDDGPYDTKQPSTTAPVCAPDVILAPMLAFDSACWRLGYGGGFYDRSIGGLRQTGHKVVTIGVAFSGQQVEQIPTGPYDMALDAVLTPDGLIMPV